MSETELLLHEEVLLLALRDRKGTFHSGAWPQSALAGALLGELLLAGCVRVIPEGEPGDKPERLEAVPGARHEDPLVQAFLREIRGSKKPYPASHWVGVFACKKQLIPDTARSLCRRGILREDEKKIALLFSRKVYPELDPVPEERLLERLERAIFSDGEEVDARTTILVAIGHRTGLLKANFEPERLADREPRIQAIIDGDFAGRATKQAVETAQASFFLLTAVVPSIVVTLN